MGDDAIASAPRDAGEGPRTGVDGPGGAGGDLRDLVAEALDTAGGAEPCARSCADEVMAVVDPVVAGLRAEVERLAGEVAALRGIRDAAYDPALLRWCEWPGCLRSFHAVTGPRADVEGPGWIYVSTGMPVLLCPDHADAGHRPRRPQWEPGDSTIRTSCECGEHSGALVPTNHATCRQWWREHIVGDVSAPASAAQGRCGGRTPVHAAPLPADEAAARVAEALRTYRLSLGPNTRESIARGMNRLRLSGGERHDIGLIAVRALGGTDSGRFS